MKKYEEEIQTSITSQRDAGERLASYLAMKVG